MTKAEQIEKLEKIKEHLDKAWYRLFQIESDLPEASEDLEMELEEHFENVQWAVSELGDFQTDLAALIERLKNA